MRDITRMIARGARRKSSSSFSSRTTSSSSKCSETITAYALVQYRQYDGVGWSQPLTTTVGHTAVRLGQDGRGSV